MKATINGKEIELTETAVVRYEGILWTQKTTLPGGAKLVQELSPCMLEVKCTDEGIILDLWHGDDCVASFGATAQEAADDLCH